MKSLHLPLSAQLYEQLRELSELLKIPTTTLARGALSEWIQQKKKQNAKEEMSRFASQYGGTNLDLDKDLEEAGLESLRFHTK